MHTTSDTYTYCYANAIKFLNIKLQQYFNEKKNVITYLNHSLHILLIFFFAKLKSI